MKFAVPLRILTLGLLACCGGDNGSTAIRDAMLDILPMDSGTHESGVGNEIGSDVDATATDSADDSHSADTFDPDAPDLSHRCHDRDGVALETTCARNVILFIGDGMGPVQIEAARRYFNGGAAPLAFETLPVHGSVDTDNIRGDVTDSAAAATAMATGHRVDNGVISVRSASDPTPFLTALEIQQRAGKRVGLVTTDAAMTDATPAAFGAHVVSRWDSAGVAMSYFTGSRPNLLFGFSASGFTGDVARLAGYQVALTETELVNAIPSENLAGVFDEASSPTLARLTEVALARLETSRNGFFLLIEHEGTDNGGHWNQLPLVIESALELRDAFDVVRAWAQGREDTLVILTADHETGGLVLDTPTSPQGEIPAHHFITGNHTATRVALFAEGPRAERLQGNIRNTALFPLLAGIE